VLASCEARPPAPPRRPTPASRRSRGSTSSSRTGRSSTSRPFAPSTTPSARTSSPPAPSRRFSRHAARCRRSWKVAPVFGVGHGGGAPPPTAPKPRSTILTLRHLPEDTVSVVSLTASEGPAVHGLWSAPPASVGCTTRRRSLSQPALAGLVAPRRCRALRGHWKIRTGDNRCAIRSISRRLLGNRMSARGQVKT